MAVTRKPAAKPDAARADEASPNEAAIRAVIERGGTVAGEGIPDEAVRKLLQLRLPVALIERIDGVRRAHDVPPYLKPIFGADVGEPRKFRQLFKRLETVRYRGSRISTVSGGGRARGGRLSRAAFIPDSHPLLFLL